MSEIDKDYYCSSFTVKVCSGKGDCLAKKCPDCHRKHPTPEQFNIEFGEEYHDDAAVYTRNRNKFDHTEFHDDGFENIHKYTEWKVMTYSEFKYMLTRYNKDIWDRFEVVCACTPWGKPPDDWEPEETK